MVSLMGEKGKYFLRDQERERSMAYKNLFDLEGKVTLVVGAAGGLAGETSIGLAEFEAV